MFFLLSRLQLSQFHIYRIEVHSFHSAMHLLSKQAIFILAFLAFSYAAKSSLMDIERESTDTDKMRNEQVKNLQESFLVVLCIKKLFWRRSYRNIFKKMFVSSQNSMPENCRTISKNTPTGALSNPKKPDLDRNLNLILA